MFCQDLGLSKATVVHALNRLEGRGYLMARPKSGYFVTLPPDELDLPVLRASTEVPKPVTVNEVLLDIMQRSAAFDISPQLHFGDLPAGIEALNRSIRRALRRQKGDDFQYYDDPAGDLNLREELVRLYSRRGAILSHGDLSITSGCQHSLFLALMASCKPGDVVAVESPGFYGALQLLEQLQLQVVEVPSSSSTGMDMDALEEILQKWLVKACIVSPAFATPSGSVMPLDAKQRLIQFAKQFDIAIIEDDIYADLALNQVPDPLKALDREGRVILCSSFSKSLSRDLRLGWVAGGRWQDRILRLKLVTQLASSRFLQQGVAEFIADGDYASHLRRQRNQLREGRDLLMNTLRSWPMEVRASLPEGGLAMWVELPPNVNTMDAYPQVLKEGITLTPGPLFSASGQFSNCLRLSFAHPWNEGRLRALHALPRLLGSGVEG